MLRRNLWIYGLGGLVVPFIGIKVIDVLLTPAGSGVRCMMIGLRPAFSTMLFLLLLTGGVYPLLTTALGQWWFPLAG
ncbi:potassium-transporting ATPase subunit C [Salmonella enterica subsp. enterica]|nr:potassium-transporting ATPase subunit C [Salmonella enterica subsp. enterica]